MGLTRTLTTALHGLDRKEIFLLGYYVSFLIVMTLAAILDAMLDNYIDVYVELFFIAWTLVSMMDYAAHRNMTRAIYSIVIFSVLTTYALLISNHQNISAFHSIVPLGFFLLFSLRQALVMTLLHHTVVTGILLYQYSALPPYPMVHNPVILVSTALTSLMVVLFGVVYHFSMENAYRQLAQSNQQNVLLLQEVHHRVKNNLNIIASMLGLQMLREEEPRIQDLLAKNKHRIRSIALVHEILYRHDNFKRINIHEYLRQLATTLIDLYDKEVDVRVKGLPMEIPFELVLRIGIIVNELIVNSIKYALEDTEAAIQIRFEEEATHYLFHYEDSNTTPIDLSETKQGKSLGLRFVDMMTRQLNADLTVRNDTGLVYTLWIPKHAH